MDILSQLPGKEQLSNLIPADFAKTLGIDGLSSGIDTNEVTKNIGDISAPDTDIAIAIPEDAPTKEGFLASLKSPLDDIKNINISSITGDISSGSLPIDMPKPSFDINGVMSSITDKLIPVNITAPSIDMKLPGFEASEFMAPINKLAAAGKAAPMKLLNMLMDIMNSFVDVVKDKDKMVLLTKEALSDIHFAQIQNLKFDIPWLAAPYANDLLSASKGNFLVNYGQVLTDIENLPNINFVNIEPILSNAEKNILSDLIELQKIENSFKLLKENNDQILKETLEKAVNILYSDKILLQPMIDFIKTHAASILGVNGIGGPVNQLKDMAVQITDFLNNCGTKAEEAANAVSKKIDDTVNKIDELLKDVQAKIEEIQGKIEEFLDSIGEKIDPVITKVIDGCNKVGEGVDSVFTKVEEVKQKLDAAVATVQDKVIDKMDARGNITQESELTKKLKEIEDKIRDLLSKISGAFEKPDVKETLNKVKTGIDTFKAKVEEVSFKPVFDLVVEKTNGVENGIKSIDTAKLGMPQKLALKVGGKVIEAVKVDEIIKPELLEAFKEIQEPLLELIKLLKEKVLIVEQTIYEFEPGAIVNNYIVNSEPYKLVIDTLEKIKPSELLEPIKKANAELTKLVEKLNPQILIDELQKMYNRVYELVESLHPDSLNKMISDALNTAISQLEQLKGSGLDNIIETIKKSISLESLMGKTGIKEIANADFWKKITYCLGGGFLNEIDAAIEGVKKELQNQTGRIDFTKSIELVKEITDSFISYNRNKFTEDITALISYFDANRAKRIEELKAKRSELLITYDNSPELKKLLTNMDLTPLIELKTEASALNDPTTYEANITKFKTALSGKETELKKITSASLQSIAGEIFDKQISAPIANLIIDLQSLLKPYTEAVTAVQNILKTVTELPAKIDASVGKTLGSLKENIEKVVTEVITTIETFKKTIIDTINNIYKTAKETIEVFSPAYLLNAFSETSFEAEGLANVAKRIQSPSGGDKIGAYLFSLVTSEQSQLLQNDPNAQKDGTRKIIIDTFNAALKDNKFSNNYDVVLGQANKLILELKKFKAKFDKTKSVEALIRLNRLIMEAAYADYIKMSVQSLHPYIVAQISMLYPEKTVRRIDLIYSEVIEKLKKLPKQMIADPLDDEFDKIKAILKANFDISGIFNVIEIKMDGIDEDLSTGLDRLSIVYNGLLKTFNERLA